MRLGVGAWVTMALVVVGEGVIAFLLVREVGLSVPWAIAAFLAAAALTVVYFTSFIGRRDR